MNRLKKISAALIALLVFVQAMGIVSTGGAGARQAYAAEAGVPRLLSGNTLGKLFAPGTPVMETGAVYTWQQEGLHATDAGLIDGEANATGSINDGDVSVVNFSSVGSRAAYGTLVYDLQAVYRVSAVQTWAQYTADSGMRQVEVYASIDGKSYNRVAATESAFGDEAGIVAVESAIDSAPYARFVKIILHKDAAKLKLGVGEVAVWGQAAEVPALLSGNQLKAGGYYAPGTPRLDAKASYKWGTDQPFATQAGLINSDNEAGAKNDGSPSGLPDLTDGSSTEETPDTTASMAPGSQGQYGTVTFTLNDVYQIGKIDVWSKADGSRFMDGYEVLLSLDNMNYFSAGYTANPNSRYANAMVNTPSSGIPGKHAKYIRIVMHNANDSDRLVAGEIAVWGWKLYDAELAKKDTPDQVGFNMVMKNYNTMYLDWSAYNSVVNKVNKYSVYIRKTDFQTTDGMTPYVTAENGSVEQKGKFLIVSSLEPDTTYYAAITPTSTSSGERKDVRTVKFKTPGVLGGDKIGDIFAINDSPYGGGNYVNHGAKEDENIIRKLILTRSIEAINFNRWWIHDSWVKSFSNKYGIGFHSFYHGPQDVPLENKQGTWSFSTVNEPDLKGTDPAGLALKFKENRESLKAVDSRNLLIEPALGGTEPASMTWLENMYKSDGQNGAQVKTYFDVLDIHPYVKNHEGSLPGLIPGAPEMLLGKMEQIEALKAKYGDQDKPVIFTELGWSTYTGGSHLRPVSEATQRDYLARAYMLAIAGGIKRMHWYSFQDDGTDKANMEHNFGLIDWYGVPKPSYYAYYKLAKVLKDAQYIGAKANVEHPYYGYEYWDESKNQYITSLWAADESTKTAKFKTADAGLTAVGIDGSYTYIPVGDEGAASLTIGGSPVFIYSASALEVVSIDDSFVLRDSSVEVRRGDVIHTSINRSGLGADLNGRLELIDPSGKWRLEGETEFSAGTSAIPVAIAVPLDAEEAAQELTIQIVSGTSLVASMKLKVQVLETIKVRIIPEVETPGQWDRWNAVLYVENATEDKELSGTISVTEATYVALEQGDPIGFDKLLPGEVRKLVIPITELPAQSRAKLKLSVELDSGFTKIVDRPFNFIAAVNDQTAPAIDGRLTEPGWQDGMPIELNRPDQIKNIANWGGEDDLSGNGYLKWDRNHLYFGMEVRDDIHYQPGTGGDIWQGDSIQFSIDTGRANGVGSADNHEFGIALGESGPIVWRWLSAGGKPIGEMTSVQAAVYRSDASTTYELALPWSELLPDGRTPEADDLFGFSMLINESDGGARRGWLEYMSGIGSSKNTQLYGDLILTQVGAPEVPVTGVALNRPAVTLDQGQTYVLQATVLPADATDKRVRFSSDKPEIATVTQEDGSMQATVTAVSPGKATITATTEDGGYEASSMITVLQTPPIVDDNGAPGGAVTTPEPKQPIVEDGIIRMPAPEVGPDGTAAAELTMAIVEQAIAAEGAGAGSTLVIDIPDTPGAAKVLLKLPAAALAAAQAANLDCVQIRTALATISLTPESLSGQLMPQSEHVELYVAQVDPGQLAGTAAAQRTGGGKPMYDFGISVDGLAVLQMADKRAVQISVDYTPAPGESAHQIVVYRKGDDGTLEMIRNGKYEPETGRAAWTTDRLGLYTVLHNQVSFHDLVDAQWAADNIEALAAREIVNGMGSGAFAPNDRVTRAQFIQMLIRAFDLADPAAVASFSDVQRGDWFYTAMASAQKLGIVQGYEDGSAGVDLEITRQDMAVLAQRAAEIARISLQPTVKPADFADDAEIASYAREAVRLMQRAGIIDGMEQNRFVPDATATRAQAAKIIGGLLFK